jgi:ferredoxin
MILYFSGTGNSAYAAKYIGKEIGDETVNLFDRIRNNDYSPLHSNRPWIVAAPVYCWQLPRLVKDWMMQTEFKGNKDVYFVLTCGSDMGNAEKYLKKLCAELGLNYKGAAPVVMPENYIAMFDAPDEDESAVIIKKADRTLNRIIRRIKNNEDLLPVKVGIAAIIKSGINSIYYSLIVKDKKFYAEDTCNGCGLCVKKCPLGNIEMVDGKPQWNGNCTHCMACIAYCPTEAIEYGKISKGKRRYTCR